MSLVLKVQIKLVLKYVFSETNTLTSGLYEKKKKKIVTQPSPKYSNFT